MTSIKSPLPGTFYQKPSPEELEFKKPGDTVAIGDVVGLVEVMKTFVEVKAEISGTFASYEIDDEEPIQAGQTIATLKK